MIESIIGELAVRVRTDRPDNGQVLPAAERVIRAVLDRCAMLSEQRYPGRILLVRRLPLLWRIDAAMLDDTFQTDRIADAVLETLERTAVWLPLAACRSESNAVWFEDESHWRASHLLATARGQTAWFHDALRNASGQDPLAPLLDDHQRGLAVATLTHLAQENVLAEVLDKQPAASIIRLATALGVDLPPWNKSAEEQARFAPSSPEEQRRVLVLSTTASAWPALPPAALRLALQIHAAQILGVEALSAEAVAFSHSVGARSPGTLVEALPSAVNHAPPNKRPEGTLREPMGSVFDTRCGGLFYLLPGIQELDVAESLWKACLPEGLILTLAAEALVGDLFADDPAPALFGGASSAACPVVSPGQLAEIAQTTCGALAVALPRRGLAELPPVILSLGAHASGRLLAASVKGSPFAFFAWPATTPAQLEAGLQAFLDAWPSSGDLSASPALAGLDRRGRIAVHHRLRAPALLTPNAASATQVALLALTLGAPSTLLAVRAQLSRPFTQTEFITQILTQRATVRLGDKTMYIEFPAEALDLALRRAALDRDPGWLPWLRRTVRLTYVSETLQLAPAPPEWPLVASR